MQRIKSRCHLEGAILYCFLLVQYKPTKLRPAYRECLRGCITDRSSSVIGRSSMPTSKKVSTLDHVNEGLTRISAPGRAGLLQGFLNSFSRPCQCKVSYSLGSWLISVAHHESGMDRPTRRKTGGLQASWPRLQSPTTKVAVLYGTAEHFRIASLPPQGRSQCHAFPACNAGLDFCECRLLKLNKPGVRLPASWQFVQQQLQRVLRFRPISLPRCPITQTLMQLAKGSILIPTTSRHQPMGIDVCEQ
mmetsp:Transcript_102654/g.203787  ORF Transcript_102654/g.203787 Transcript_102654/m.203787 type:complete len:247 (+) Transcript_102654:409-1149(+)